MSIDSDIVNNRLKSAIDLCADSCEIHLIPLIYGTLNNFKWI